MMGSLGAFSDVSYRRRARSGGARAYISCTIWTSSVGRRDPMTAKPRSGRGRRVVEGVGGAHGAVGGDFEVIGARSTPAAGASRAAWCVCSVPDLGIFRRSSGPGGGGASLWPRQVCRGGGGRSSRSCRRGLRGYWSSVHTPGGRLPGRLVRVQRARFGHLPSVVGTRWRRSLALAEARASWRGWEELVDPSEGSLGAFSDDSCRRRARSGIAA